MPARWTVTMLSGGAVLSSSAHEIQSVEINGQLDEKLFKVPLQKNQVAIKDGAFHRVNDDGQLVRSSPKELYELSKQSARRTYVWIIVCAVAVVVTAVLIWVIRRNSANASAS
jgi:hypothetical protein